MTLPIDTVIKYIDDHSETFVKKLSEMVAIKSISSNQKYRPDCMNMVFTMKKWLESLGAKTELRSTGKQTFPDGTVLDIPPVILADLGNDPKKTTLLIYGHIDVQPALKSDGWNTEPFVLQEIDGKMFGRGSSDDKGPVLGWLHVIEAMQQSKIELPLNLKFVFECMEESGSEGLEEVLQSEKGKWLNGVDYVVISDNYWLGTTKPCLTYGLRGICYYEIEITCAIRDLHSGVYGGTVPEAMTDLVHLMGQLVDNKGIILIPGITDAVRPTSDEEMLCYGPIDLNISEYQETVGCKQLLHDSKVTLLQHRWRFPCLSLHGIEGAFSEPGSKTVIPAKVIGKFSIRIVPDMEISNINKLVCDYITARHKETGSVNEINVRPQHCGRHWLQEPWNCLSFKAATIATEEVWGMTPDFTREGGSIPITLVLQDTTGKSVLLLPMGQGDDGAHSQNEKLNLKNYIYGTKLMARYMMKLAELSSTKN